MEIEFKDKDKKKYKSKKNKHTKGIVMGWVHQKIEKKTKTNRSKRVEESDQTNNLPARDATDEGRK